MPRRGRSHPLLERAAVLTVVAWLAASTVLTLTWRRAGWPAPADLASTAVGVEHGRVWALLSSMLPVSRYPFAELVGCALAVAVALRLLGGVRFWAVALSAHVGSALIAYVGIAVLWLVAPVTASRVALEDDYGISAVWLGSIGAVAVVLHCEGRRRAALVVAGAAVAVTVGLAADADGLAVAEHLIALAIGAAVARALASPCAEATSGGRRAAAAHRGELAFDPQGGKAGGSEPE